MNESAFFQDLAMLMALAGIAAIVFSRLGWPKVLGYILAGVVMNEYTWGGSFLADETSIQTIGQLGIVFLMLTLGLEFSAGALKKPPNLWHKLRAGAVRQGLGHEGRSLLVACALHLVHPPRGVADDELRRLVALGQPYQQFASITFHCQHSKIQHSRCPVLRGRTGVPGRRASGARSL